MFSISKDLNQDIRGHSAKQLHEVLTEYLYNDWTEMKRIEIHLHPITVFLKYGYKGERIMDRLNL